MQRRRFLFGIVVLLGLAALVIGCSSSSLPGGGGSVTTTHLLVTDYGNSRSLIWNLPLTTNAPASIVLGQPNMTTGTCGTTQSTMCNPNDGGQDSNGNLWIADYGNNRVLEFVPPFTSGMNASTVLGQANFTASTSGTTATTMNQPANVAFDSNGDIFVLDYGNSRVLEFKPPFTNGMAASVVLGQANMTSSTCATTAAGLCSPWQGIAMDANGNLWVGDRGNCRAVRYSAPFATGMAATLVMGEPDLTTKSCGLSATQNGGLSGVAVDPSGNLWSVDASHSRVLMFPTPFTNGEAATVVIGQPNFTSTGGGTSATAMSSVYDVSFDSSGNLYVAEYSNKRVTFFPTPFSNGMAATMVICEPDLNTATTGTSSTQCGGIEGVTAIP